MASHHIRACLITNPRSGRGGIDLSLVLPVLEANGWDVTVRQKREGGRATDLARQAAKEGYSVVVDCGGDGTLNEIVDGLVGTDVAVAALPGGTVNEWTRELGISPHLDRAALQLVGSLRRTVDVGRVTIDGAHDRHFLLMAGFGFDGAVMAHVSKPLKNRIGALAVGLATLRTLPSFDAVPLEIAMDEVRWQGRAGQIIISNTRRYGGITEFAPNAYVDDGLLDICILTATGAPGLLREATSLLLRQTPDAANAALFRAGNTTIHAAMALPLQLDGGVVKTHIEPSPNGVTYRCSLVAQGLTVLVPATYSGDLFQRRPAVTQSHSRKSERKHHKPTEKHHKATIDLDDKREMHVIAVGLDTITAARARDGYVFSVVTGPKTSARDIVGREVPLGAFLSILHTGDVIHVKGPKDRERGIIEARRISLRSRADGR